jgi:RNA polymerase sigma-70 factor (ECF subfamily)
MDAFFSTFASMRPQLERIAYRILRSHAEAQAVIDIIAIRFRLQSAVLDAPADPRAWLLAATSRLAIERCTVGEVRRRETGQAPPAPSDRASVLLEDILTATVAALERLEPDTRLAFLLHDIFDAEIPEVATTLGRGESECRELVECARRELHRHHHRHMP